MTANMRPLNILMADDDEDDRMFAKQALREARLSNELVFVEDGQQLLDYLRHEGRIFGFRRNTATGADLAGFEHAANGWT